MFGFKPVSPGHAHAHTAHCPTSCMIDPPRDPFKAYRNPGRGVTAARAFVGPVLPYGKTPF